MNSKQIEQYVNQEWDDSIIPTLVDYIRIPNKSPEFDPKWEEHGYMEEAMQLIYKWCAAHPARNMNMEIVRLENRTPLLFIEIPGDIDETVLLYGHMDKQPEMEGWNDDLGPWKPVIRGDKLYGRGGADDGYAVFASLTAINALQAQNIKHPRCVIIIEGCEESGSVDLPHYVEALKERIGEPKLVICLDTSAGNYEQLWTTTSLRGVCHVTLRADILKEGQHSGAASGISASSFRILRQLLSRIEDETSGRIKLDALHANIPAERIEQAKAAADALGDEVVIALPFIEGARAMAEDVGELLLNRTWRPTLSVTGMEGIPDLEHAGNVLRPSTTLKLSFRLPPTVNAIEAGKLLEQTLMERAPYGAKITCTASERATGWDAPPVAGWLATAMQEASQTYFGKSAMYLGEGGSIPFIGMLGRRFPNAQFFITGVLGPRSNAHGPNEFLHLPMGKKLTCCVAHVLANV